MEEDTYEETDEQGTVISSGVTKNYYQTLGFNIFTSMTGDPKTMNCQVFSDYDNMSFNFIFEHDDNQYIIDGGDVTPDVRYVGHESDPTYVPPEGEDVQVSSIELFFKIKWTKEMGILGENSKEKHNRWRVYLIAKSSSGFSYKIPFGITHNGKQTLPTSVGEAGKKSTNVIFRD